MKKSTIIILPIIFSLIFAMCIHSVFAEDSSTAEFCGKREVVFTADSSDIENFISGGRSALELALRKNAPSWLTYNISGGIRDVSVELSFNFDSLSSYEEKSAILLTYEPIVFYSDVMGTTLVERHDVYGLLGFISDALNIDSESSERSLSEIFSATYNVITVDGELFLLDTVANVRPPEAVGNIYDSITVDTAANENGSFTRRITVTAYEEADTVKMNFENAGEVTENEDGSITVEFSADTFDSVTEKTMGALRGIVVGKSKREYAGKCEFSIHFKESFDLGGILKEGGYFSYVFDLSELSSEVTSEQEAAVIEGGKLSVTGNADIALSYKSLAESASIDVLTDISDPFGKIVRTVTLEVPLEDAVLLHSDLMKALSDKLPDGVTLTVSDNETCRSYEYSFRAYSFDEIAEITETLLKGDNIITRENSLLPFTAGTFSEKLSIGKLKVSIESVTLTYDLGSGSVLSARKATDFKESSSTVKFESDGNIKTEFTYRRANAARIALYVFVVLILGTAVTFTVFKIRSMKAKPKKGIQFSTAGSVSVDSGNKSTPITTVPPAGYTAPSMRGTMSPAIKTSPTMTEAPAPVTETPKLKTTMKTEGGTSLKKSSEIRAKYCENCGSAVKEDDTFCAICGSPVNKKS